MALPGLVAARNLADVTDRERAWDNLGLNITRQTSEELSSLIIGQAFGGGYFAGYISHTADGSPTHALIVAPRATGATGGGYTLTTNLAWKTTNTGTAGTSSAFDGAANTAAMVAAVIANHPAAEFCVNLSIGGFTDWYLPARYEMDIAYFNLKPGTQVNDTLWGINDYSVPKRTINNTATYPSQTNLTAWQATAGSQAFVADRHWSSTEASSLGAWRLFFSSGGQVIASSATGPGKNNAVPVRAFRRIAL